MSVSDVTVISTNVLLSKGYWKMSHLSMARVMSRQMSSMVTISLNIPWNMLLYLTKSLPIDWPNIIPLNNLEQLYNT